MVNTENGRYTPAVEGFTRPFTVTVSFSPARVEAPLVVRTTRLRPVPVEVAIAPGAIAAAVLVEMLSEAVTVAVERSMVLGKLMPILLPMGSAVAAVIEKV